MEPTGVAIIQSSKKAVLHRTGVMQVVKMMANQTMTEVKVVVAAAEPVSNVMKKVIWLENAQMQTLDHLNVALQPATIAKRKATCLENALMREKNELVAVVAEAAVP